MKKLNLSGKSLSYIQIEDRSRNSYCKSHCLKYDSFEHRDNNCYICCEQKECIMNNDPLSKVELEALLNQILQETVSDEFKQQQKQKINTQKEELNKQIEIYCEKMILAMEKNCEQQNQQNQQVKQVLEKQEGLNCLETTEILKQQELDCLNVQICVHSTLSKDFHRIQAKCEAVLNYMHSLCQSNYKEEDESNVLRSKFHVEKCQMMKYERMHEICIKQQKQTPKRIYQDEKNELIIVVCTGQDLNNQITIIKPSKYSLFGQFETLRNSISAEIFCISPSGEYYAWGSSSKYQIYHTALKTNKQMSSNAQIDCMAFSETNDFVISTIDQRINFWGLTEKNWEFQNSFNMLPERVNQLIFIDGSKKLICKSENKLTILIKEKIGWMIHQQIHQTFQISIWSYIYQFIITVNERSQIQVWSKNKKDQFQVLFTEWDPEQKRFPRDTKVLEINSDGTLLLQQKHNNKAIIRSIQQDGKLLQVLEQNVAEDNIAITKDFTNIIAQDEKSLIWYQLIYDDL